jgi:hypothetical protein
MELYRDLELTPTTLGAIAASRDTTMDVLTEGPCCGPCCDGSGDGYCPPNFVSDCSSESGTGTTQEE